MLTDSRLESLASRIDSEYALRHNYSDRPLAYGTAGFRTAGEYLPPVAARVITIAVMRAWFCGARNMSKKQCTRCSVGFMITASHNRAIDNGFKIIDTDGGMLTPSWEHWCTAAANAATGADLVSVIKKCANTIQLDDVPQLESPCGLILLGRDTRESGLSIAAAAADILSSVLAVPFTDFGVLTTPQLHFLVAKSNDSDTTAKDIQLDAYHEQVISSLEYLFAHQGTEKKADVLVPQRVVIDCANGVGTLGVQRLIAYSQSRAKGDILGNYFSFELVNYSCENPSVLNYNCGADYAKQRATPSDAMRSLLHSDNATTDPSATHFYCLDGDADRIVAFLYGGKNGHDWILLDGDRIAILYALLLRKWLTEEQMKELDVGVVQTAYANGASTEFLKSELGFPVYITATGVKNLHPVAHERDIGVYFEANGHGTVLFSDRMAKSASHSKLGPVAPLVCNLRGLLSQVCGDAIGDLLMCEVALRALNMTFEKWAALYTDLPCNQVKVTVGHPKRITTTEDEQRALSPEGMQNEIDTAVSAALLKCKSARSFARPSGTEPVVRVYAEASSQTACDALSSRVCSIVEKYCN
jgi:phosphoacetylglucosamine mutase